MVAIPVVAALEAAVAQAAVASEVADKRPERICHLPARPEISVTEVSYVVQVRAEGPEAPSPGHRPGL